MVIHGAKPNNKSIPVKDIAPTKRKGVDDSVARKLAGTKSVPAKGVSAGKKRGHGHSL